MINLTKTKKKSATEEIAEEQEMESDALNQQLLEMLGLAENPEARSIMLMGDLTEEKSLEIITALIVLSAQVNAETGVPDPIKIYVSTYGGSADEMFGIYDVMNMCKEKGVIIETVGLGKVMSAGTLILSAGSKGHRKIGKHTRVMIVCCSIHASLSVSRIVVPQVWHGIHAAFKIRADQTETKR